MKKPKPTIDRRLERQKRIREQRKRNLAGWIDRTVDYVKEREHYVS